MLIEQNGTDIVLKDVKCFNLDLTLDCGEAFRWKKGEDGFWRGAAYSKYLEIKQLPGGSLVLRGTDMQDFENVWYNYFDFGRDYAAICREISKDEIIAPSVKQYYGIRILRQQPWEALASFVISQQNNIPRIKAIIEKLCAGWGNEIKNGVYSFPTASALAVLSEDDFKSIGAGYRAKYLCRLAQGVNSGSIELEKIGKMSLEDAKAELLKINGVGIKVANCALLFGFNFLECFPVDVWIERALQYYPNGLPECFQPYQGIAQQYLYHWARNNLK
ncbi:MAG: DNA-3-methyladenine glycosylase 2 family protein [Clostridiales bacterium]|nr:DNA-3-methyladenine glycosylase 2 family protein [Clostridiales bacterium]